MANAFLNFTASTVGTSISYTGVGFKPTEVEFEAGAENGASGNLTYCSGCVDSSLRQKCRTLFFDGTNRTCNQYTNNTKCISVWKHTGGTWVEVVAASLVSFDNDGFTLNITAANSNYQLLAKCRQT